ncbi:MAG: hydroxymyristoyl-ACP dehydratase [Sphingobacteriales bacterium]|nr:MAG: hydroxymyristoyl-ACP dehydratase [Sphingobacteriales bacterium]
MEQYVNILARLPYSKPFLFVDSISTLSDDSITGSFYLDPELDFYRGHFKDKPVTPGVILTEIMAQIGLVCLGLHLTEASPQQAFPFALSSTEIEFMKPVFPGETVTVTGEKVYFRFGKLKCKVSMKNAAGETVCEGTIAGIQLNE